MICPFGRSKTQALAIYIAIYIESLTRAKMSMLALCGPPTQRWKLRTGFTQDPQFSVVDALVRGQNPSLQYIALCGRVKRLKVVNFDK